MAVEGAHVGATDIVAQNPKGSDRSAHPLQPGQPSLPGNSGHGPGPLLRPIMLVPSRKMWWANIVGGAALAAGLFLGSGGDRAAMLIAAFFAVWTVIGVMMLLPGAASLRLDENGFAVTRFFRKKSFRWSDVSDFGVVSFGQNGEVVGYKTAQPRLSIWDRINTTLAGGRDSYLPDTYGMTAEDLAELMRSWRNSANTGRMPTP